MSDKCFINGLCSFCLNENGLYNIICNVHITTNYYYVDSPSWFVGFNGRPQQQDDVIAWSRFKLDNVQ